MLGVVSTILSTIDCSVISRLDEHSMRVFAYFKLSGILSKAYHLVSIGENFSVNVYLPDFELTLS